MERRRRTHVASLADPIQREIPEEQRSEARDSRLAEATERQNLYPLERFAFQSAVTA